MGYERKRGKLMEFMSLLRGGSRDFFSEIIGPINNLSSVKYLITLDSDTQLPQDAARRLVGTMAHPLNHPVFDEKKGLVVEGYGILQPRVDVSLPSSRLSLFVRLFVGDTGIDPYTRQVSDVYQDVFHEGSFVGKGIFDVDAFQRAIDGHFPENTILSHDLLESCYARSGLVSDITFYDDFPSNYLADMSRRLRWIRGDWQIAKWLRSRVYRADGVLVSNPLSPLSQWKIFDNLRRSLVPVAQFILVVGTWFVVPQFSGVGTLLVVFFIAFPGLLSLLRNATKKRAELPWSMHVVGVARDCSRQLGQMFLALCFLPHQALSNSGAIGKTCFRLLFHQPGLLEWQTSSESGRTKRAGLQGFLSAMWMSPALALACGCTLVALRLGHLSATLPILILWLLSPGIAWMISRPTPSRTPTLSTQQRLFLRRTARRTWLFFEAFVTEDENALLPDNFQEIPEPKIASRTSPTNIGLSLLANLSACDFGYISTGNFIQRTHDTFATLQRMEKYNGHLYNWYETRTLHPLRPLYVSSVDSGNLAGHLLTLGSGLREHAVDCAFSPRVFEGLLDTAGILQSLASGNVFLNRLINELVTIPANLLDVYTRLLSVTEKADQVCANLVDGNPESKQWALLLKTNCNAMLSDLLFLIPWLPLPPPTQTRRYS